jgi:hypothetical protein
MAALGADGGIAICQQSEQADGEEADGHNDLPRLEATASRWFTALWTRESCHGVILIKEGDVTNSE